MPTPHHTIHWVRRTPSTQNLALNAAEQGARTGVWVADEQTQGRGRLRPSGARAWQSPPRAGLWFSTLLTPNVPHERVSALTIALALACAHAIHQHTNLSISLKWPNDLLVNGRKLGGILTQGSLCGRELVVVAGIGINLDLDPTTLPDDLSPHVTSVRHETQERTDRLSLLTAILERIERELDTFETHRGVLSTDMVKRWESYSQDLGRSAHRLGAPQRVFRVTGLDPSGALRIIQPSGASDVHTSGELVWLPQSM